jgi:hypothetical protein
MGVQSHLFEHRLLGSVASLIAALCVSFFGDTAKLLGSYF